MSGAKANPRGVIFSCSNLGTSVKAMLNRLSRDKRSTLFVPTKVKVLLKRDRGLTSFTHSRKMMTVAVMGIFREVLLNGKAKYS